MDEFRGLQVVLQEIIPEMLALKNTLRPLISSSKKTTRVREVLQKVGVSDLSVGGAPPRGNRTGGRADVGTLDYNAVFTELRRMLDRRDMNSSN